MIFLIHLGSLTARRLSLPASSGGGHLPLFTPDPNRIYTWSYFLTFTEDGSNDNILDFAFTCFALT